eukprot:TRINITY_DN7601_c0_g1_i1.p1 TRINITY_DN7601_c0_g1~~TRINITY_DN7601_c0_g1_i1.p1  ORF type:complete len:438 (+),score=33.15 TRINITY_DN7601_c0_g1_i1:1172-2485(+)
MPARSALSELPLDLLETVFTFLGSYTLLCTVQRISRRLARCVHHASAWRNLTLVPSAVCQPRHGFPLEKLLSTLRTTLPSPAQVASLDLLNSRLFVSDVLELVEHCGPTLRELCLGNLPPDPPVAALPAVYTLSHQLLAEVLGHCPQLFHLRLFHRHRQAPLLSIAPLLRCQGALLRLELHDCGLTNSNVGLLGQLLPHLRHLKLKESLSVPDQLPVVRVECSGWTALMHGCPNLVELELTGISGTSSLLAVLATRTRRLRCLRLRDCGAIQSAPLRCKVSQSCAPTLPDLQTFLCSETVISCRTLAALAHVAPNLQTLLADMVNGSSSAFLGTCTRLRTVALVKCQAQCDYDHWGVVAEHVRQLQEPRYIEIFGCVWCVDTGLGRPFFSRHAGGRWHGFACTVAGAPPCQLVPAVTPHEEMGGHWFEARYKEREAP